MSPLGFAYLTNLTRFSTQKRGHADAFGLNVDNVENQPAQKRMCTPQTGAALFTPPGATERARAESFDPLFDEVEIEPALKQARIPLAPVTVNTPSVEVYNDEDDDLNSLFGEEDDDFCSSEDLEAATTEAQAKEVAETQEELRKELAAQKAAKVAEEKAQAQVAADKQAAEVAKQKAAVVKAANRRARKVAKAAAAKQAAEDAGKEERGRLRKEDEKNFAAKQWKEVMKKRNTARRQSSPNNSETTSATKVNQSSLVIDLTDDEPIASTTRTQRNPGLFNSSPVFIDLSEDDSNESGDTSQQDSPLRNGTEAATQWLPPTNERLSPCLDDLEFPYNTNGFPLQQAKIVCRRTSKQERAANPKLGSHIKELDFAENMKLNRELLNHTIANTSISINGQKGVKDTIEPLVDSLHGAALQSIRYVDGSMHRLCDFKLLADRCQIRGIKLTVEELRVQPTWLWTEPEWHKSVCTEAGKCRGRNCPCKKVKEGNHPEPEVRDVDVKRLLAALGGSTDGQALLEEVVLMHGIKTLSECLACTKVLSINLGFNLNDFKNASSSLKEARDNLLAVDDKYRLVFRKRLESQDCELVVRFATEEEKKDAARSYQAADAEMLEWLETLSASKEGSAEDMMSSDSTEASAATPSTENRTEDTVDDVVSSQEKMRKMMKRKENEMKKEKRLKRQEEHAQMMMRITRGLTR